MTLRHENKGSGGGGSQPTEKITLISSRNTISCEETATGYDINVANEEALRYVIHNYREFMEAAVDIGQNRLSDRISCVMQLVNDIDMTEAEAGDENLYRVNGLKLLDYATKEFRFGKIFYYTTILCDGTRRVLQLTYPEGESQYNNTLNTWTLGAEWLRIKNVAVGGGISSYNRIKKANSPTPSSYVDKYINTVNFSRYLLKSSGNLNYALEDCELTCCGNPDNSFNPFIYEGAERNRRSEPRIYHTRLSFVNCEFFHGADPEGNIWSNCNAPIVIYSIYDEAYERSLRVRQLTKNISESANETGCPYFQFRTVDNTDPKYDTIKNLWENHPWQVTSDGTALVTNTVSEDAVLLETKIALRDLYLQGNGDLQPENASLTKNYVSLVDELVALRDGKLSYWIGTQAQYDNLQERSSTTLYIIIGNLE